MAIAAERSDEILDATTFLDRLGPDAERQELIHGRVVTLLNNRLPRSCMAIGDGSFVKIDDANMPSPDVFVDCSPLDLAPRFFEAPVLVGEVLSPSTEAYDRGEKWRLYRRLPSLRHYLLVSQTERRIEHYAKAGEVWRYEDLTGGATLALDALEIEIPLDAVYEGIL